MLLRKGCRRNKNKNVYFIEETVLNKSINVSNNHTFLIFGTTQFLWRLTLLKFSSPNLTFEDGHISNGVFLLNVFKYNSFVLEYQSPNFSFSFFPLLVGPWCISLLKVFLQKSKFTRYLTKKIRKEFDTRFDTQKLISFTGSGLLPYCG